MATRVLSQPVGLLFADADVEMAGARTLDGIQDTLLPKLLLGEIRVGPAEKVVEEVACVLHLTRQRYVGEPTCRRIRGVREGRSIMNRQGLLVLLGVLSLLGGCPSTTGTGPDDVAQLDSSGTSLTDATEPRPDGTDLSEADTDGDGITDAIERLILTDPDVPNLIAPVSEIFCNHALQLADDAGLLYNSTGNSRFLDWAVGDLIVVERRSSEPDIYYLANLRTLQWATVIDYGEIIRRGRVTAVAPDLSAVEVNSAEIWEANLSFASEFARWLYNDPVLITRQVYERPETGQVVLLRMINLRTCEAVLLSAS